MSALRKTSEGGIILVLLAVGLSVLLILIGLALDTGNLYRARLALQQSADAAALAGLEYPASKGWFEFKKQVQGLAGTGGTSFTDSDVESFLKPKAEQIARANMGGNGYPHLTGSEVSVTVDFNSQPDQTKYPEAAYTYKVTVSRPVSFLLIHGFLSSVGKNKLLSASAIVARRIANVAILLDVSDSMNCPSTGTCACLSPARGMSTCGTTGRKMDDLIDAMKVFVKMFDLSKDRLMVVPFNISSAGLTLNMYASAVSHGMLPPVDELTESDVDEMIDLLDDSFPPQGATNVCDALMKAQELMKQQGIYSQKNASYLIVTDGAPTAGTFLLADAKSELPIWPAGSGTREYVHWTVQWIDKTDGINRAGPSILVQRGLLGMNDKDGSPPAPVTSGPQWADCSVASADAPQRPVGAATDPVNAIAEAVFSPCLNTFAAHLPENLSYTYGGDYGKSGGRSWSEWREQYYNCAIALTDQLRDNKGMVYVIGTGDPAPMTLVEDLDGDGRLDVREDVDNDGHLDVREDLDSDGRLDENEDANNNGRLDKKEDRDHDGNLDVNEDVDGDGKLDNAEDVDGDGRLDVAETDHDGDGVADASADPYQGVHNIHLRHDFFNARLANDYLRAVERPMAGNPPWQHPENWGIGANYKDLSQWSRTPDKQGEYLAAPTTRDLTVLFEKMARRILSTLVE